MTSLLVTPLRCRSSGAVPTDECRGYKDFAPPELYIWLRNLCNLRIILSLWGFISCAAEFLGSRLSTCLLPCSEH